MIKARRLYGIEDTKFEQGTVHIGYFKRIYDAEFTCDKSVLTECGDRNQASTIALWRRIVGLLVRVTPGVRRGRTRVTIFVVLHIFSRDISCAMCEVSGLGRVASRRSHWLHR